MAIYSIRNGPTGAVADTAIGAPNGVAPLDSSGLLPSSYLPSISITSTSVVASEAAMLALDAEEGDVAVRTDFIPSRAFILTGTASVLGDWQALDPAYTVTTVNGLSGDADVYYIPPFVVHGTLQVSASGPFAVEYTCVVVRVFCSLKTQGSTSTTVVLKRNGSTVATVTIPANTTSAFTNCSVAFVGPEQDVMTAEITSAGTGAAGLTIQPRIHL